MFKKCGIVLHPTSLPGKRGIGQIGPDAHHFVRQLAKMGCTFWQVLPLGPTSYGDSPYQSLSSFAGNHLLIDLDCLVADGLLDAAALADYPAFNPHEIDYGQVIQCHEALLSLVAQNFIGRADQASQLDFQRFCERNCSWLDDYCLFRAIKEAHEGRAWPLWPKFLASREPAALEQARNRYDVSLFKHKLWQYLFAKQWRQLRDVCVQHGIQVIGDIPIFVAHDSADVWADPQLFYLDKLGQPTVVAGVPPDYFSKTGQRWGNPIYRWGLMAEDNFAWWCRRLKAVLELVDMVRIDHFRGFEAYWEIPASEATAAVGCWQPGPSQALFDAFKSAFGMLPIIAEDLGVITPAVEALRDNLALPGMKVLHFILDASQPDQLPSQFPENSVCYTGTHDNNTSLGWFAEITVECRRNVRKHLNAASGYIHKDVIHCAWSSNSAIAMAPLQDVLGLGPEARLNLPGRPGGNWRWRYSVAQLSAELVLEMATLSQQSQRFADAK